MAQCVANDKSDDETKEAGKDENRYGRSSRSGRGLRDGGGDRLRSRHRWNEVLKWFGYLLVDLLREDGLDGCG
jgi:hypothetical protein